MMPTVTIDADVFENLQEDARNWASWVAERGWGDTWSDPGDLDPVEPDPEPSVEEMLDVLLEQNEQVHLETGHGAAIVSIQKLAGVRGILGVDWRDALRAAYRQVVGE